MEFEELASASFEIDETFASTTDGLLFLKDHSEVQQIPSIYQENDDGFSKFATAAIPMAIAVLILLRCLSIRRFWSEKDNDFVRY